LDRIGRLRRLAAAGLRLGVDETRRCLLRALLARRLREVRLGRLLLRRRRGALAGLHQLVDLRHVRLQIDLLVLAERAVGDPGLDEGELLLAQREPGEVPAEREADRVERLVVLAGELRARGE